MSSTCFFVSGFFLLSALVLARNIYRVRQWPRVKANVVHWREASPFGKPAPPRIRREHIVLRRDGTEVIFTASRPSSTITYFAELVYFSEGGLFAADLAFDEPTVDSVELLVDPDNPRNYDFPVPGYRAALALVVLGLVFLSVAAF